MLKGYTISRSKNTTSDKKSGGIITRLKLKAGLYLFLLAVLVLISSISASVRKTKEIMRGVEEKRQKLEKLRQEESRLKSEIDKVTSEEFIERQIRDNLGLAKDGEFVIILPEPNEVRKFALKVPEEKVVLPEPNWKRWLRLFF